MADIFLREVTGQDIFLFDPAAPDASESSESVQVGALTRVVPRRKRRRAHLVFEGFAPTVTVTHTRWVAQKAPRTAGPLAAEPIAPVLATPAAFEAPAPTSEVAPKSWPAYEGFAPLVVASQELPAPVNALPQPPEPEIASEFVAVPAPPVVLPALFVAAPVTAVPGTGALEMLGYAPSVAVTFRQRITPVVPVVAWSAEDEENDLEDILLLLSTV